MTNQCIFPILSFTFKAMYWRGNSVLSKIKVYVTVHETKKYISNISTGHVQIMSFELYVKKSLMTLWKLFMWGYFNGIIFHLKIFVIPQKYNKVCMITYTSPAIQQTKFILSGKLPRRVVPKPSNENILNHTTWTSEGTIWIRIAWYY